jgi:hypothetical protein
VPDAPRRSFRQSTTAGWAKRSLPATARSTWATASSVVLSLRCLSANAVAHPTNLRAGRTRGRRTSVPTAGKNNLCIAGLPHAVRALLSRSSATLPRCGGSGTNRRWGLLETPGFTAKKARKRGWAGRLVFAKALPAMGIMAIGGWPKGFFTHQFRQFRVISATTQKCCSREMDR